MLPFLDKKKAVGVIISRRGKEDLQNVKSEMIAPNDDSQDPAMHAAAEDVLRAIDQRSVIKLAAALKNAFVIADRDDQEDPAEEHIEHPDRGEL